MSPEKFDLNIASVHHLKSIKGIGQGRAEAIVRYRDKNGPFASVDDLAKVPHVGDMPPRELDQAKQHLMVQSDARAPEHKDAQKIDVNQANVAELRQVSGIGEAHAQAIVAYREEHGKIEDLSAIDQLPYFRDQSELERQRIKKSLKV
ncbi:MAG TPA: helix-hairpin-helix domain-containing protein [Xanthobacteraceae bacterium]|nr:helix-hairpin-helix domain-containing protein [Xanthobacteraceae bacterium]